MAKILTSNLFAILFLTGVVLVKSLPTSVLVDTKEGQQQSDAATAMKKGKLFKRKMNFPFFRIELGR